MPMSFRRMFPTCRARGFLTAGAVRLRRFRVDRRGAVAPLVALLSPVLIGAMGLGAETGHWYLVKRSVQNAADVAAHGAALRRVEGDTDQAAAAIARFLVQQAGFGSATGVTVNMPPSSGAFQGSPRAVEVLVSETVPRRLTAIYTRDPVVIAARAVGLGEPDGRGCVIALSTTQPQSVTIAGSPNMQLAGCDIVSNGPGVSLFMEGDNSTVSVNCMQTVGTATTTIGLSMACTRVRENSAPISDPYAGVPEPQLTGPCQNGSVGQNGQTIQVTPTAAHASGMNSVRYCNGLNLRGTVNLNPGIYLVQGGEFRINANAVIDGTGVTFYLAQNVNMVFNGTARLNLAAPTSGTYAGILFFGSRNATTVSHSMNGNLGTRLDGAIYTPSSHVDISGNSTTSAASCTQVITNTVRFQGNGALNINCANPSGQPINLPGLISLVE